MKKILTILFGMLGFASCSHAQSDSIKTVSAAAFAQVIQSDSVILVDVRTADEYNAGHIDGARNIDVLKADLEETATSTGKDYRCLLPLRQTKSEGCRYSRSRRIPCH